MPLTSHPPVARRLVQGALLLILVSLVPHPSSARAESAPRLNFYPSLQLRFVDGQAHNYFFGQAGVVNVSGSPMTGLTLRQKFPEGFTAKLIRPEAQ